MRVEKFTVHDDIDMTVLVDKLNTIGFSVETKIERVGNLTSILVEKYFMRNSNVACCSISIYSHSPIEHDVIVMSGGSSQGAFIKLSWGADSDFINSVCNIIKSS